MTKAQLLEVIQCGYKHGYGPSHLSKITGRSASIISRYAKDIGVACLTTRPNPPAEAPVDFLVLLMKCGLIHH